MTNANYKRNWVYRKSKDKFLIEKKEKKIHDIIIILLIYLSSSISHSITHWLMQMIWKYILLHNSINELRLYNKMIITSILNLSLYKKKFEKLIILKYLII